MDFEMFLEWLTTNGLEKVASFLSIIFGLVIMIIQVKKYKINSNQAKELKDMKYRTANYREEFSSPTQTFATEVEQYRLNKSTNELEVLPDKLDIQQVVQSAEQQALPNMLSHLEPPETDADKVFDMHNDLLDKLDYFREADSVRLELCKKYNLDARTSLDKLLKVLSDEEKVQRGKIQILQNIKKEGVVNETSQVSPAIEEKK